MERSGIATSRGRLRPALAFVGRVLAWIVAFLALTRIPWIQGRVLIPYARWQRDVACGLSGASRDAVSIDFSCTGADAMALCVGAILAFPVSWKARLQGALVGLGIISVINTVRVGHLALIAGEGRYFQLMHFKVWPAVLIAAVAVYVFAWMRFADSAGTRSAIFAAIGSGERRAAWRFVLLTVLLVALYYGAGDAIFGSPALLPAARAVAATAGWLLALMGFAVEISRDLIRVGRFPYRVTQECIASPLIPVYLAAALALPGSWRRRSLLLLLALPVFFALGVARLLVVALPRQLVGSQSLALHAFNQIAVAVLLALLAAWWSVRRRRGAGAPWSGRALLAVGAGAAVTIAGGRPWAAAVRSGAESIAGALSHHAAPVPDPQAALALLPALQLGLFVALWLALAGPRRSWGRLAAGASALALFQLALLAALSHLAGRWDFVPAVATVRAVTLVVPVLLALALSRKPKGGGASDRVAASAGSPG